MPKWMTAADAMRYFGLGFDPEKLEQIVVEYDLDAEIDDENEITHVGGENMVEALFEEHKKIAGFRPDDPVAMAREKRNMERREKAAREKREAKRPTLVRRVNARLRKQNAVSE